MSPRPLARQFCGHTCRDMLLAIHWIANQRKTQVLHVNTDLVGTPGFQRNLDVSKFTKPL